MTPILTLDPLPETFTKDDRKELIKQGFLLEKLVEDLKVVAIYDRRIRILEDALLEARSQMKLIGVICGLLAFVVPLFLRLLKL